LCKGAKMSGAEGRARRVLTEAPTDLIVDRLARPAAARGPGRHVVVYGGGAGRGAVGAVGRGAGLAVMP
ncbi:hypothetical protein, partial [Micromonospora chalcea]|uniref:hypothetical protein n=1 Tax=Micromonospora chalcea TaxID=1874 RepID=UPI003323D36A